METSDVRRGFVTRFFPPPSFLLMSSVGIDISDQSVKFLQLTSSDEGEIPLTYGEEKLPQGAVVGGEIRDPEKLVSALRAVAGRVETRFVRASLPEQKAYFFTTQVPADASREQVLKVLEFRLEEHVPLSPQEAIVDYDIIALPRHSHDGHMDVGVTVYPKDTVEKYINVFLKAGLTPLSFEIEAQAIERAVVLAGDTGTYMIIDLGETSTGIAVVSHGALGFTSTLDVAGSQITEAILSELKVKASEVVTIKNTVGIAKSSEYATLSKRLMETIAPLSEEIKRHRTYWGTRESVEEEGEKGREDISRVILCGGNANLKGLPEYLEHVLGVPVERANVWQNAFSYNDLIPGMLYGPSLAYATSIGLALRSMH